LRYDEDWSYLRDRTKQAGDLDKLKYIPLGKSDGRGWYLSLGSEARASSHGHRTRLRRRETTRLQPHYDLSVGQLQECWA